MSRLLHLASIVLFCFPSGIEAQYSVVELADVQLARSPAATIQDPAGSPVPNAVVQEFSADWKKVLRSSSTDVDGKFSLSPVPGRNAYFIQISSPGFDPLRVHIRVDTKRGRDLKFTLIVAT